MRRKPRSPALFLTYDKSDSSIVAGDIVSVDKNTDNSVIRTDASDPDKMPAIGIVKTVRNTSVVIQRNFVYTLPTDYNINIASGDILYADPTSPGKITKSVPTSGTLQKIGIGKKASKTLLLTVEPEYITL